MDYTTRCSRPRPGGLKHNDIARFGSYRTKETIREFYDPIAAADAAEIPYETPITPPPGRAHDIRPETAGPPRPPGGLAAQGQAMPMCAPAALSNS